MSQRDVVINLAPGAKVSKDFAGAEFVFCKFGERQFYLLADNQRLAMQEGDKAKFDKPLSRVSVENPDPLRPLKVILTVGKGDFNRMIVNGQVTASGGIMKANGSVVPDTRVTLKGMISLDPDFVAVDHTVGEQIEMDQTIYASVPLISYASHNVAADVNRLGGFWKLTNRDTTTYEHEYWTYTLFDCETGEALEQRSYLAGSGFPGEWYMNANVAFGDNGTLYYCSPTVDGAGIRFNDGSDTDPDSWGIFVDGWPNHRCYDIQIVGEELYALFYESGTAFSVLQIYSMDGTPLQTITVPNVNDDPSYPYLAFVVDAQAKYVGFEKIVGGNNYARVGELTGSDPIWHAPQINSSGVPGGENHKGLSKDGRQAYFLYQFGNVYIEGARMNLQGWTDAGLGEFVAMDKELGAVRIVNPVAGEISTRIETDLTVTDSTCSGAVIKAIVELWGGKTAPDDYLDSVYGFTFDGGYKVTADHWSFALAEFADDFAVANPSMFELEVDSKLINWSK